MADTVAQRGRLMEPGLRKLFFDTYKEKAEQFSQYFKVADSRKNIETDVREGGFGLWDKKGTMASTKYQDAAGEEAIQYKHETFSSGFIVEKELMDDEQYNVIKRRTANLARTARATVESLTIDVLNRAWLDDGYDGVTLISSSHPRLDKGTALTNSVSGALTDANLRDALILSRQQQDENGILIQMHPSVLIVGPQLEYTARTILESANISPNGDGTLSAGVSNAATDKNTLPRMKIIVLDYLQPLDGSNNPSASGTNYPWFIMDPTLAQLTFFWRERMSFKGETDFDTDQYKYKGRFRMSYGYSDWRGLVGSPGH